MLPPPSSFPPAQNPHPSRPSRHTPLSIRTIRIVVWLSPTIAIVASLAGMVFFNAAPWLALLAPVLVLVIAGCFDAVLSRSVPMNDGIPELRPVVRHAVRYMAFQIIFAPVLTILVVAALVFIDNHIY